LAPAAEAAEVETEDVAFRDMVEGETVVAWGEMVS